MTRLSSLTQFIAQKRHNTGLYIHWPFCESKCPYCDFNSHVRHVKHGSVDDHIDAIIMSLDYVKHNISPDACINTIFFGGGTPSLIPARSIEKILTRIYQLWPVNSLAEITLEANPSSSERERFKDYRTLGINRLSIGVQALNDKDLRALGRWHDVHAAYKAIDLAHSVFDEFSFDLIHTRIGQTLKEWEKELHKAIQLARNHISLYELTIEPNTVFSDWYKKGKLHAVDEEVASQFFTLTRDICKEHGFTAYEISNFCRNNKKSRHNMNYWQSGDYIGIGAGAHSRIWYDTPHSEGSLTRRQMENEKNPRHYLHNIQTKSNAFVVNTYLDADAISQEFLLMGLRLKQGISLKDYAIITGKKLDLGHLKWLSDNMLIQICDDILSLTDDGMLLTNYVINSIANKN